MFITRACQAPVTFDLDDMVPGRESRARMHKVTPRLRETRLRSAKPPQKPSIQGPKGLCISFIRSGDADP